MKVKTTVVLVAMVALVNSALAVQVNPGYIGGVPNQAKLTCRCLGNPAGFGGWDMEQKVGSATVTRDLYNTGRWQASNAVTMVYDPAAGTLTSTVVATTTYTMVQTVNLGLLNYLQLSVGARLAGTTVDFNDVVLNGETLGNFHVVTDPSLGWKDWYVSGIDMTQGFTLTGNIVLSWPTPPPTSGQESNKVVVSLGRLPNSAPVADAGDDQTVEQANADGASVSLDGTGSSDPDNDPLSYTWTGAFGTATGATPKVTMPAGVNTVTLTVSDGRLSATDTVDIKVVDTTPPTATLTVLKSSLWPPNHQLVLCARVSGVSDVVDPDPLVDIQVACDEPANGNGDGNTEVDWQIVPGDGTWEILLRAERSGSAARNYTIQVVVTDAVGNHTVRTAQVTVPADQGKRK